MFNYIIDEKVFQVGKTTGRLHNFIVEPFVEHNETDEMYMAILSRRDHDIIMFYEKGGIDVGDIDTKVYYCCFMSIIQFINCALRQIGSPFPSFCFSMYSDLSERQQFIFPALSALHLSPFSPIPF